VLVEPCVTPGSRIVYGLLHAERTDMSADVFDESRPLCAEDAFDSNQAVPTLLFWKHPERLARRVPGLKMLSRERFAFLAYPATGGFSGPRLAPPAMVRLLELAERPLALLTPLLAMRTLVVLERVRA
jgi:hypothetical protein